jgi:hypothetical protein
MMFRKVWLAAALFCSSTNSDKLGYALLVGNPFAEKQSSGHLGARLDSSSDNPPKSCRPQDKDSAKLRLKAVQAVDPYHLVWSPGFWRKLVLTTGSLVLAQSLADNFLHPKIIARTRLPLLLTNAVLPLFASACCLLQLGLNLFSVGCAGFNTILGPWRPYMMAVLLWLTCTARRSNTSWSVFLFRWTIALLPEYVYGWNALVRRRQKITIQSDDAPMTIRTTVQLNIPSMGCVACINSIDVALLGLRTEHARIRRAVSTLNPLGAKGGQAVVEFDLADAARVDETIESLCAAVERAGFNGCTIESVRQIEL